MHQQPLINCGSRWQRGIARYCPELDHAELCSRAGVSLTQLQAEGGGLTPREYGALLEALVTLTGNDALPFLVGLEARVKDFGLFGFSLMSCSSLDELQSVGGRYSPLNGYCFTSRPRIASNFWALTIDGSQRADFPGALALLEEFMALSIRILSEVLHEADTGHIKAVHLTRSSPIQDQELASLLRCPVLFGQAANEIQLQPLKPSNQPEVANQDVAHYLWKQCEEQLQLFRAQNNDALDDVVRQFLRQRLPHALPSHNQLAQVLNMSSRTLNRRLADCGTSFRQLVTEERMLRAHQMLEQSGDSVEAIAMQLGYAQPSSFFRAYRKFYGVTPKAHSS